MIEEFISLFHTESVLTIWDAATSSSPIWVPVLFFLVWFNFYMGYKQRKFISEQGSVLLEIKIPREISRSPQAMEMFLNAIYNNSA
ncbi:MAG: hypothetical protein AAB690_00915, partial [Patescibacteria group bacterium]